MQLATCVMLLIALLPVGMCHKVPDRHRRSDLMNFVRPAMNPKVVTRVTIGRVGADRGRHVGSRQARGAPRPGKNLVFKPPMSVSFSGEERQPFQQQVISAGGFMSLSSGADDAFNHPNSEPEIITAPPTIVQLVVRTAMGDGGGEGRLVPDSGGAVTPGHGRRAASTAATTTLVFGSSGATEVKTTTPHGETESLLVTEAGDRNPFPNIDHFLPTSRFQTPYAAPAAEDRLGHWARATPAAENRANRLGPVALDVTTTSSALPASSTPSGAGERRRNKIGLWRKRLLPRPGLTPRPKMPSTLKPQPSDLRQPLNSLHGGAASVARSRGTTVSTPTSLPRRPPVSRPPRPRPQVPGKAGHMLRPAWPPLGADDKEVVEMATMDIPRLPTTGELAEPTLVQLSTSASSVPSSSFASSTTSSVSTSRGSSPTPAAGSNLPQDNARTSSTFKPSTGDGMATGSEHEELWVTPKVEIRSSSRPYHEIVSPGAIWRQQHFSFPSTRVPIQNILQNPPGGTQLGGAPSSEGDEFDGFYGEPVPSEILFPNGSRILTSVGHVDVRVTDQQPASTTPISAPYSSGAPPTRHPPYVYNDGYTSPRPILFNDHELHAIDRHTDASTVTSTDSSSASNGFGVGTYTYPGFTPSVPSGATQQAVVADPGSDTGNKQSEPEPEPVDADANANDDDHDDSEAAHSNNVPDRSQQVPGDNKKRGKFGLKQTGAVHGEEDSDSDAPGVKKVEAGIVREVVLDTEKLAYILIGTCCALSIICLVVVVVSMRCRKLCRLRRLTSSSSDDLLKGQHHHHHHHGHRHNNLSHAQQQHQQQQQQQQLHHAKFVDWEDGVLESHVSVRSSSVSNNEATTHRLGTWFNGKAGLHGKNNMALPMGFKSSGLSNNLLRSGSKRGAYYVDGKTSSTRDLVSINSENSAGRHRRRRKTSTTVGYRVDANSSSPFGGSSRASSRSASDDEDGSGANKRPSALNNSNKEQTAAESVHLCPAGPEVDQVEIVNFRKLPSPQFPSATGLGGSSSTSATSNSNNADEIYAAATNTTSDENSSEWTQVNAAPMQPSSGSAAKDASSTSSQNNPESEEIHWSSNDERLI